MRDTALFLAKALLVAVVLILGGLGGLTLGQSWSALVVVSGALFLIFAAGIGYVGTTLLYREEKVKEALASTVVSAVISCIVFATLSPLILTRFEAYPKVMSCLSNMKQLSTAAHIYLADNDEVFPPAESWQDQVRPYLRHEQECPDSDSKYTYGMNAAIGGVPAGSISTPERTVLFFEMDSATPNAHGWARDAVARHEGFFYVAFVDGSAGYSHRTLLKWSR